MIYDSIAHLDAYDRLHPNLVKGLRLLAQPGLADQADGTYQVDGDKLYYFLQSYETKAVNDHPEAHKHYADIMMMLEGQERIGVAPLESVVDTGERPEGDIRFYSGETVPILLKEDRFAVFLPGDAHAPGIAVGAPAPCRKCVVKVRLD